MNTTAYKTSETTGELLTNDGGLDNSDTKMLVMLRFHRIRVYFGERALTRHFSVLTEFLLSIEE